MLSKGQLSNFWSSPNLELSCVSGILSYNKEIMTNALRTPCHVESLHTSGEPVAQATKGSTSMYCHTVMTNIDHF